MGSLVIWVKEVSVWGASFQAMAVACSCNREVHGIAVSNKEFDG